jgi:hypothetical protein
VDQLQSVLECEDFPKILINDDYSTSQFPLIRHSFSSVLKILIEFFHMCVMCTQWKQDRDWKRNNFL